MRFTKDQLCAMFELREGGVLYWKSVSKFHPELVGRIAGGPIPTRSGRRYWTISVGGRKFKRSRLVFCMVTGRWPELEIDHIDCDSLNDAPANLREATRSQNTWNRKSYRKTSALPIGVKALRSGRYQARIGLHRKSLSLGTFPTPEEAHNAYEQARRVHFGEFA